MNNDSCGSQTSCVWRASTRLRTSPTRLCVAINREGDPCGARAVTVLNHRDDLVEVDDPMLSLCQRHWNHLVELIDEQADLKIEKARGNQTRQQAEREKAYASAARRTGSVYFAVRGGIVKIGHSLQVERRIRNLETQGGVTFDRVVITHGDRALEQRYHRRFAEYRGTGEWFTMCPEIRAEMDRLADYVTG